MSGFAPPLLDFIKTHQSGAIVGMFVTGVGESFPVLGVGFPGTSRLIAAGPLGNQSGDLGRQFAELIS